MAVATPYLQFPHSPRKLTSSNDAVLLFRSTFLGTTSSSSKICRTRSSEFKPKQRPSSLPTIRRACSANFDTFSDKDFSRKIQELANSFQISDENFAESQTNFSLNDNNDDEEDDENSLLKSPLMEIQSVEMKAKSLDLPLSLRMIKRKKKQLEDSLIQAGESAYCSVKTAFSSMVFIIRELHSYTLQMREILYFEDLQGILGRVQSEMHASFVWLFQQVFSHTPTLMVYVMILLANFTVHSMSTSAAIAVSPPVATVEEREFSGGGSRFEFDGVTTKSFTVSWSSKTTAVGGNNGGGNTVRPVGSGMDGDSWMNNNSGIVHRPIVPDGVSSSVSTREDTRQNEDETWNKIVDEASRMQSELRDESLGDETMQMFVSPVSAKIEADDYVDFFKTELHYQSIVAQDPTNALILANYAQFLYLVVHDFDRAEEYFKRATKVEPKDADAHNRYAHFLWQVRNDLWAAEETFLEAISADPGNSFYAGNYASFLWNTGGEDTCYPLDDETLDE
ncbi:uncharacterized protein LOC110683433 [Chenopodium quinoa]|uniref:Uncharacterized protein n=1 Tax=Chenopodium quinoa TaxID=63459 RepID=A0A803LXA8_CHEQI|nr:uncharacterized protein LOC110683433 [Chenopodium quinoa]